MHEGHVLAEAHLHEPRVHAQHLSPLVHNLLTRTDGRAADVGAVAVSMGPGSYTGLRIGVSTAKGWAMAYGAALVGIPTLEALAAHATPWAAPGDTVCALLDARRDDVYAAAYRIDDTHALVPHAEVDACSTDALPDWLGAAEPAPSGRVWLLGDGAPKSEAAFRAIPNVSVHSVSAEHVQPSAAWVARQAVSRLERGDTDALSSFEPFYLKAFHGTPSATSVL